MSTATSIALFIAVCAASTGLALYTDCGSVDGKIISVHISNCGTSARCILKRRHNVTMEINFKSNVESSSLQAVVHGIILGVPVLFDLPNPDGCKDSGVTCPVENGSTYKYVTTMPISSTYPRVTVDIKWELRDDQNKDLLCALIPAKIG
ncbi:ecdysteroid-regulated 16 kDa protein-like [Cylas formicarius]|uniref:ecdysteroid-regulated 16 kDa protein-like n=1 Tax=Cylas formicarius TaxID=197179 RepID=UPI0029586A2E|nr:ecdysteroid-regulated 16 kDa protein-like [Cylas formicarius]